MLAFGWCQAALLCTLKKDIVYMSFQEVSSGKKRKVDTNGSVKTENMVNIGLSV